jgi:hypothetical protein
MSVITKVLRAKAVYWPPIEVDCFEDNSRVDDFGRVVLDCAPVEILVRWEDIQEDVKTEDGTTTEAKSKVMVSQDVEVGGYLRLGPLTEIPNDLEDPRTLEDVFEVIKFDKIPNFRYTEFLRVAYL